MSEENVELARRLFPGTVDMVSAFTDPEARQATRDFLEPHVRSDFEMVAVPGQIPVAGPASENPAQPTYRGIDGFLGAWGDWLSAWETWVLTPTDFIDLDEDRVLVFSDLRARSKTHEVEFPIEAATLLTVRDGKLARMELFFDRAEALEAAGLSE
jgi:ketosteroid isomerase-like protein